MNFKDDVEIVSIFINETREHLGVIEDGILMLEKRKKSNNDELIHGLFRAAHSIKAGANLLELKNIEKLSHGFENALQLLRQKKLTLEGSMVDLFLEGVDKLNEMINNCQNSDNLDITSLNNRMALSHIRGSLKSNVT